MKSQLFTFPWGSPREANPAKAPASQAWALHRQPNISSRTPARDQPNLCRSVTIITSYQSSRNVYLPQERAYAERMDYLQDTPAMDWTDCPLVEVVPGKVSGVPLLRGTRLPADTVLSNYEAGSPVEEISDNFDVPEQTIRELLTYPATKQNQPQP